MLGLKIADGPLDVLCLGAHPDDIEIGCGGTLLALAERPDTRLSALVMTGNEQRMREADVALSEFFPGATVTGGGLPDGRLPGYWDVAKEILEELALECRPNVIFTPRTDDAHQDHRVVGELARTVWRDALILHYEIPKWDGDLAAPTHFVAVSEDHARLKVKLLNACFPSQAPRDWWDDELFVGLMRIRGVECRSQYAEAFFASKVLIRVADRGHAEPDLF